MRREFSKLRDIERAEAADKASRSHSPSGKGKVTAKQKLRAQALEALFDADGELDAVPQKSRAAGDKVGLSADAPASLPKPPPVLPPECELDPQKTYAGGTVS